MKLSSLIKQYNLKSFSFETLKKIQILALTLHNNVEVELTRRREENEKKQLTYWII